MAAEISWRMRGDVMEACSCATTCPRNFGSDPTPLPCDAIIGWRIREGHRGDIRLDGLNVVLYLRIPGKCLSGWLDPRHVSRPAGQPTAGGGPDGHLLGPCRRLARRARLADVG